MNITATVKDTDFKLSPAPDNARNTTGTDCTVTIDTSRTYQTIEGFGGAFTDAAANALNRVSPANRQKAIDAYFHPEKGINYTLCRTHINSCDFSTENYAYCDTPGDTELKNFSIKRDITGGLLPLIKDAMKANGGPFKLFASPWSPPAWMKDTGRMNDGGRLLPEYYPAWARYFARYLKEYEKEGVPMWGVSIQNEPQAKTPWDNCLYSHEEERDFVKHLGPALKDAGYGDVKIIVWDHNKDLMQERARTILSDSGAAKYVWAVGFHWYGNNDLESVKNNAPLDFVTENFPGKKLMFTEGCNPLHGRDLRNEWWTGEKYGHHIISDLNHGTVSWTDWNMVLDETGGPNHVGNFCDAPVIADTVNDALEFHSPYYYMGHFSKFLLPGSVRMGLKMDGDSPVKATAFKRPDGTLAMVVINDSDDDASCTIMAGGEALGLTCSAHSIQTVLL